MPSTKVLEKHTPTNNPLSSFAWFPPRVFFATQDNKEKVVLLLRQHWITNLGWMLFVIILIVAPMSGFWLDDLLEVTASLNEISPKLPSLVMIVWYMLVFGFAFTKFLHWYFNVYIVTDKRIIDVDFYSILYKKISEADLIKVQDVTHRSVGTLALIFNYGDLVVQTAAEFSDIEFDRVPSPSEVHKIIGELVQNAK